MRIVLFGHPADFLNSRSMPKMLQMMVRGMQHRGHDVSVWSATPWFQRLPFGRRLRKWLGYLDQFVVFSLWIRLQLLRQPRDTVYVFTDQALGPWVPAVARRPNVVHLNDFLAIRSALGEFPQNPTGWPGRIYQALIRRGLRYGQRFVAISEKTRSDLHRLVCAEPSRSQVVYLGLNYSYRPLPDAEARPVLQALLGTSELPQRYLFHVGGNQWYKNREGVLALYAEYVRRHAQPPDLWIAGGAPTSEALQIAQELAALGGRVRFFSHVDDLQLCALYSCAAALLFPSIAEGFGWPIAEAMACGCPVVTTAERPMQEVGGNVAFYVPAVNSQVSLHEWAQQGVHVVHVVLTLSDAARAERVAEGLDWVRRFDTVAVMEQYEATYAMALRERSV